MSATWQMEEWTNGQYVRVPDAGGKGRLVLRDTVAVAYTTAPVTAPLPMVNLYSYAAGMAEYAARTARKSVMRQARQAVTARIQRERDAQPDQTDYFKASDYGTRADALEARYALLKLANRQCASVMQYEPSNEGRGQAPGSLQGTATNGTKVRAAEGGRGTARKVWTAQMDERHGTDSTACYRVHSDGTREKVETPRKARTARTARTKSAGKPDYQASLRAIAQRGVKVETY